MARDLFDRRLTDPTAVVAALNAAVKAANANFVAGLLTPLDIAAPSIAERLLREPEGMNGYFGGGNEAVSRVSLGWWTDATGRKFARVRGWRERGRRFGPDGFQTAQFDLAERDRHGRPGVWHVDWERVVEASAGGEPEWVAVCGCGAAGSPASLAWQHGMCGPCADRVAEFGPAAVAHFPGLLDDAGFEPTDVLFLRNGHVFAGDGQHFRVWDAAGAVALRGERWDQGAVIRPVVSPDGRFVFLGTCDGAGLIGQTESGPALHQTRPFHPLRAAFWTGRPGELLVQALGPNTLNLLDVLDDATRPDALPPDPFAVLHAVWPDATAPRAVFAAGHHASVVRVERDGTLAVEARFLLGDGRLNRTGMWQAGPEIVRFTPDGERLLFVRNPVAAPAITAGPIHYSAATPGAEMELRLPGRPKALLQETFPVPVRDAAFSPDYEHLFVLGADGALYVCNPGTLTSVRARLRWHIWPPLRLAVSPDGQTLATAGPDGVKLWPVARLLPLLG